ncbi:histone-lysine N-methyltransferase EZA1-like [Rutidosis leptorrhynchoides]|uniref:histone-lysine N-methyltransferase EZA1-like n=1 Tax=Rutidosis leptorrhynchoides TaxID=125765 RepID=UPI003A9943DF
MSKQLGWNFHLAIHLSDYNRFKAQELHVILSRVRLLDLVADQLVWAASPTDLFNVADTVRILVQANDIPPPVWPKVVWGNNVPSKIMVFHWLAIRKSIPVKDVLANLFRWWSIRWVIPRSIVDFSFDWFYGMGIKASKFWKLIGPATIWAIWTARNDFIFNGKATYRSIIDLQNLMQDLNLQPQDEQMPGDLASLTSDITQLKQHIQAERAAYIKERIIQNNKNIEKDVANRLSLAESTTDDLTAHNCSSGNMLSLRMKNPICVIPEPAQGSSDQDCDRAFHVTDKLPAAEKIPKFITWFIKFLSKRYSNQVMGEDQSIVGKEPVKYDKIGGKAPPKRVVNEDSDDKHEFSEGEKRVIRMVSQCYEPTDEVVQVLQKSIHGKAYEIHDVFKMLKKNDEGAKNALVVQPNVEFNRNKLLNKSLATSMDTFDSLYCTRCWIFDCRLHGYGHPVIVPAEKLKPYVEWAENEEPCSDQCYKKWGHRTHDPLCRFAIDDQWQWHIYLRGGGVRFSKAAEIGGSSNFDMRSPSDCPFEESSNGVGPDIVKNDNKEDTRWRLLEKELFLKGLEMFGKNSCLIARNLLHEEKTCNEVYKYMDNGGPAGSSTEADDEEQENALTEKSYQKKGRRKKHNWKSPGHSQRYRGIAGANRSEKQYTPCECKPVCGKDCPCVKISTCEKYCGCPKSCRYRFRGCHCAKSHCRNLQCPCFATRRECDPDICRNCWVSCGGGDELGEPPKKGGQCGNMRLLLGKQQKILLGISDVSGWGAFVKNTVEKDEFLGEYNGELLSQSEANVRGKIYDDLNSSFLFDLNDEYVVDSLRQGNKLKFANHSPNPNCYAKILKVGGDHRVGIFAKHRILPGEEIFYDYAYEREKAPSWARKPVDPKEGPPTQTKIPQHDPKEDPSSLPPPVRSEKP